MTDEPAGWGWPGFGWPGAWPGACAGAAGVERADDAVVAALRALLAADDVAWVSPAAVGYRAALAEEIDAARAIRARLDDARSAAARHDAAVDLAREARRHELAALVLAGAAAGFGSGLGGGG